MDNAVLTWVLTVATVLGGLSAIGYFLDKIYDFRESRPKAELQYRGDNPPILCVTVYNPSQRILLHVHRVRVYFGDESYCYALVLDPETTTAIPAKGKFTFILPYEKTIVERRVTQRKFHRTDIPPSFDSPANLFLAIANGPEKASWLEIQYNEDKYVNLLRGKVKKAFQTMLEIGRSAQIRHSNIGARLTSGIG